jgi:hypothetical protein
MFHAVIDGPNVANVIARVEQKPPFIDPSGLRENISGAMDDRALLVEHTSDGLP